MAGKPGMVTVLAAWDSGYCIGAGVDLHDTSDH